MSAIFPKRGRRQHTADESSWVDLDAPPPITEKRQQSPFAYLRIRKRSTEGPKKGSPPKDIAVRRIGSVDSLSASYNTELMKPLPPVPPLLNHNRGYSSPQLMYGAQVYPQIRPPGSESSLESSTFPPTPPSGAVKFPTQWDTPSTDNMLSTAHALLPTPSPMVAAAAVMSAQSQSHSPSGVRHSRTESSGHHGHEGGSGGLPMGGHQSGAHHLVAVAEMDKAKVAATVGPLITMGMQNLTKAQTVVDDVLASEAWTVVKENVVAVLAPAKDVVQILDSVTKYIPAVMVAESVLSVIVKHELERHENDKNILVVYHTISTFWFTLCDLQTIFRAAEQIKGSMESFFQDVNKTTQEFGNFREVYYRHGHFARTLRSTEYRTKLAGFAKTFVDHKAQLQFLLTESSALQITDMNATVGGVAAKLDTVTAKLDQALAFIARQTPLELSVAKQVQDNGGEKALQNPQFLNELAKNTFGHEGELSAQVHASLRQGLDEALSANMPAFSLRVEAAQKEMAEAVERSTETILQQLNSGPYQLIKDEDIKAVWKGMNWRISCKARHFVDAVHNHFAQKFGEHQQSAGEVHPDQWTLNVLSQVIYYPNISDAIDDDGSGYISVHEVNQFFKSRPTEWSAVQWLSFWAAGWKQNALDYRTRCKALFSDLEASARTVLPENRRSVKAYIKTSGLSELWLVVNSLIGDGMTPRSAHQAAETGPLNALRAEIMQRETDRIRSRLEKIQYQLESPETVLAVLGTHRLEGFILCFLELILDRHCKIVETANGLVLGDREFDAMTYSLRNLVAAFSTRYHSITESWKQQRLDTNFLVESFAGGIFNDWHEIFQDNPTAYHEAVETPKSLASQLSQSARRERPPPPRPEDILAFPLPPQPSPTRATFEDPRHGSPPRRLAPLLHPQGPRRRSRLNPSSSNSTDYFFHFDFERRASERPVSTADPGSIPEVYKKTKKPKLEDRITSLETELSDIKSMLNQLILLSTPRRDDT